jgi:DNA-3-methyladenine glycosylase II
VLSSVPHGPPPAAGQISREPTIIPDASAATFPHPPQTARAALDRLAARDAVLGGIEAACGPLPWRRRPAGFPGLLAAIVAQQISNQAAAAIWRRLAAVPGALTPEGIADLPDETLRGAGLSRPKVMHARSLAAAFADGRLSAEALATLPDEAAVAAIAGVRGLGRWSAEVYLLFAEARADIFPAADLALAASHAHLTGAAARPSAAGLLAAAEAWRPSRGLAARLLWHHWRHVTGRPSFDD